MKSNNKRFAKTIENINNMSIIELLYAEIFVWKGIWIDKVYIVEEGIKDTIDYIRYDFFSMIKAILWLLLIPITLPIEFVRRRKQYKNHF